MPNIDSPRAIEMALSPDVVLELIADVRAHRAQLAEAREVIEFYAEPFTCKARAYLEKYK